MHEWFRKRDSSQIRSLRWVVLRLPQGWKRNTTSWKARATYVNFYKRQRQVKLKVQISFPVSDFLVLVWQAKLLSCFAGSPVARLRCARWMHHRFRWYATFENKTPAETFPEFPSIINISDRSDRNPLIKATSVTFRPSLRHASGHI